MIKLGLSALLSLTSLSLPASAPLPGPSLGQTSLLSNLCDTREVVQKLSKYHPAVIQTYDAFSKSLQTAYATEKSLTKNDVDKILSAVRFAAEKHEFQVRKNKDKTPYIIHPMGVADSLMRIGGVRDVDVLIAALLHDTVEDTDTTFEEVKTAFGAQVEDYVREVTDDKTLPKAERKRLQIVNAPHKSPGAATIKLADKFYNLSGFMLDAPPEWSEERINAYFAWAKQVVDNLPAVCPPLKHAVDAVIAKQQPVGLPSAT